MAGFLYYVPKRKTIDRAGLIAAGLENVFPTDSIDQVEVFTGPDGDAGVVFAFAPPAVAGRSIEVGFYPERQTWNPAGQYWIGYPTNQPPGPADLERAEIVAGHTVTLQDNREWLVPVARTFPNGTKLPQSLILGPQGELVREVLPRYAALWHKAEGFWESFIATFAGGPDRIDEREAYDLAAEALAINYRVGPRELSVLRVFTTANLREVLLALIDWPSIALLLGSTEKKTADEPGK